MGKKLKEKENGNSSSSRDTTVCSVQWGQVIYCMQRQLDKSPSIFVINLSANSNSPPLLGVYVCIGTIRLKRLWQSAIMP